MVLRVDVHKEKAKESDVKKNMLSILSNLKVQIGDEEFQGPKVVLKLAKNPPSLHFTLFFIVAKP